MTNKKPQKPSIRTCLMVWNGMASRQVSGGDIYIKKLLELSDLPFDVSLPSHAKDLICDYGKGSLFRLDSATATGSFGQLFLYLKRTVHSTLKIRRSKKRYQLSLAASPFFHDILPVFFSRSEIKAVVLFHLIPKRQASSFATGLRFFIARIEQKISLFVIKHFFDVVLAGNNEVMKEVASLMPGKAVCVANAGIDLEKIGQDRKNKDPNLAVFIGRLTTQKGILDLVNIAKDVSKKQPDFRLVMIGDGPDRRLLEEKIKAEGADAVEVLGFVDDKTKYDLLKQANFFLFPSYEEGWGIALAEALYAECHCVCYEIAHYRSLFSGYPSYTPMADASAFAKKVSATYNEEPSSGQRKHVEKYDYPAVISDVEKKLRQFYSTKAVRSNQL